MLLIYSNISIARHHKNLELQMSIFFTRILSVIVIIRRRVAISILCSMTFQVLPIQIIRFLWPKAGRCKKKKNCC